ncbi:hypothetical protein ES692_14065 [Psychroserpens burtonensis]|uniref:Uncharacterized protein n=1 Tax=Psychroserpens burtonensis TaxID=49278 RepID=A0A5C7B853_9FLAO|nr:hypothetical protein [Psychroserpens burtonensis]TXE16040.1 hypothetical protein ES692_14065 [Psychroserpens burtonensis]
MILDTTHNNKEHKNIITDLIGRPYTFMESIKMRGVGSKRMIIENVSPNLQQHLNTIADINYANIEMRPSGILIYINKGLKNYTWVIPFYQLVIYKTNGISIHAQGKFVHFKNNTMFKENKVYMDKLFDVKVKFDERYSFQY